MSTLRNLLLSVVGLGASLYGLYCMTRLHAFIKTNHYWDNPWFYKANACMFGCIALALWLHSKDKQ